MCDTFVVMPDATLDGEIIFGKNSDRPNGEIQDVVTFPAQDYPANSFVQCTYLRIPQIGAQLCHDPVQTTLDVGR